jgi:hypothetical protein
MRPGKYRGESTGRHEQDRRPAGWETEGGDDAEVRNGKWGAAAAGEGEETNGWAG